MPLRALYSFDIGKLKQAVDLVLLIHTLSASVLQSLPIRSHEQLDVCKLYDRVWAASESVHRRVRTM